MSSLKEYIITLKNYDDLFDFYEDIESPSGNMYIPNRRVECCQRRMISRNTHYLLTDEEANTVRNDPRVLAVERRPEDVGITPTPLFIQTENTWHKGIIVASTHKNWALLRCVEGQQRANWGRDGQFSQSGTIQVRAEGRNVDVVIVDGLINPDHPEFAVNADGTGGTRVIQYNWFQHNLGQASSNYVYTPYVDPNNATRTSDNDHGAHCAGTAAGNTQGWARSANIYNISPYTGTDPNGIGTSGVLDYIRAFHNSKPVNPITGRRNPTICNHSWGFISNAVPLSRVSSVFFRGNTINGPFTVQEIQSFGIRTQLVDGEVRIRRPVRVTSFDNDMLDAANEGIIMLSSAGNNSMKMDIIGGIDYGNYFVQDMFSPPNTFYHRGGSPSVSDKCISVGNISAFVNETKATSSNAGPRVDIYAPGEHIVSSINSSLGDNDPRNSNFKVAKKSGTSMACPQVCGVLATALEVYPSMTPTKAREYITHYARVGQMTDTGGDVEDTTSLQGADNRYLFYYKEREDSGQLFPKNNVWIRPESGRLFPRTRTRR